jgi:hypothetical protein
MTFKHKVLPSDRNETHRRRSLKLMDLTKSADGRPIAIKHAHFYVQLCAITYSIMCAAHQRGRFLLQSFIDPQPRRLRGNCEPTTKPLPHFKRMDNGRTGSTYGQRSAGISWNKEARHRAPHSFENAPHQQARLHLCSIAQAVAARVKIESNV